MRLIGIVEFLERVHNPSWNLVSSSGNMASGDPGPYQYTRCPFSLSWGIYYCTVIAHLYGFECRQQLGQQSVLPISWTR